MKTTRTSTWLVGLSVLVLLGWANLGFAQTFVSGSTGADGAFTAACAPTPCTVTVALPPSGVFNYTTVTVPAGITVTYTRNAANTPVTILATGDVTVAGILSVNGTNGANGSTTGPLVNPGSLGGPGGFTGGKAAHGMAPWLRPQGKDRVGAPSVPPRPEVTGGQATLSVCFRSLAGLGALASAVAAVVACPGRPALAAAVLW